MYYDMISMMICIAIFLLYIYLDYNRHEFLNPKESFIVDGHPTHDRFAPIPYSIIAKGIKNPNDMDDENVDKELLKNALPEKMRIQINNPGNEKFYTLSKIEDDLKYFNNATNLLDMNAHNDGGQLNLF